MKQFGICLCMLFLLACGDDHTMNLGDYGIKPDSGENVSPLFAHVLEGLADRCDDDTLRLILPKGRYDFYEEGATQREYFISNHDQDNPKCIGLALEKLRNVVIDGQGSELIFHGRMLPITMVDCEGCTVRNLHIDFELPHLSQATVLENDTAKGVITYQLDPWVKYAVRDSNLIITGEGWEHQSRYGMAFEPETKRIVYQTSDVRMGTQHVEEIAPRTFKAPWKNVRLIPGTVLTLRCGGRPTPGLFLYRDRQTQIENVQVHYAEGMGLLAQMSEDITLNGFSVCLRGENDPRYFTTQADATHFSGCKGTIRSVGGLYEGMMDDAINVHGNYLKVLERTDDRTIIASYGHPQLYGFLWGEPGDTVKFIKTQTMESYDVANQIAAIQAVDRPTEHGATQFRITFEQPIDPAIGTTESCGVENLTWTPEVYFAHNLIRNNRARGALFSTPRRTVIEENVFDHTSGTAILLCGDCNGWYETGACHDVLIRKNHFINALTSLFQFTNAVISIYPEIPDLAHQEKYFHSGIVVEDNLFETFDQPILYAKSVDGLTFRRNQVRQNDEYPPYHWNSHRIFFQRVVHAEISDNQMDGGYDEARDLLVRNE